MRERVCDLVQSQLLSWWCKFPSTTERAALKKDPAFIVPERPPGMQGRIHFLGKSAIFWNHLLSEIIHVYQSFCRNKGINFMDRFFIFICNFCLASNKQSKASPFSDTGLVIQQSIPEFAQGFPLAAAQPVGGCRGFPSSLHLFGDAIKTFHCLTMKRQRCLNYWVIQKASFWF